MHVINLIVKNACFFLSYFNVLNLIIFNQNITTGLWVQTGDVCRTCLHLCPLLCATSTSQNPNRQIHWTKSSLYFFFFWFWFMLQYGRKHLFVLPFQYVLMHLRIISLEVFLRDRFLETVYRRQILMRTLELRSPRLLYTASIPGDLLKNAWKHANY